MLGLSLFQKSSGPGVPVDSQKVEWIFTASAIPLIMLGWYLDRSAVLRTFPCSCSPLQNQSFQWQSGRLVAMVVVFGTTCPRLHWSKWMSCSFNSEIQADTSFVCQIEQQFFPAGRLDAHAGSAGCSSLIAGMGPEEFIAREERYSCRRRSTLSPATLSESVGPRSGSPQTYWPDLLRKGSPPPGFGMCLRIDHVLHIGPPSTPKSFPLVARLQSLSYSGWRSMSWSSERHISISRTSIPEGSTCRRNESIALSSDFPA